MEVLAAIDWSSCDLRAITSKTQNGAFSRALAEQKNALHGNVSERSCFVDDVCRFCWTTFKALRSVRPRSPAG